jgi:hypothetical protein
MMMTLRRLGALKARAASPSANAADIALAMVAVSQRMGERNASKLARRMRRKHELGRSGAI